MWSMMAASVVDFPDPVVPVSRIRPRSSSARSSITGGRPSSSTLRTERGITRATIEIDPRWRKALTRKRASPGTAWAKSTSPSRSNSVSRSGCSASISRSTRSASSGWSTSQPSIAARFP